MTTKIITQPTKAPITLDQAKDHLRVTIDDDDSLISELIISARVWTEVYLRRALLTQTWELYLDQFPDCIELPYSPIQSVTSVKYIDSDGAEQTLATSEYSVYEKKEPGLIVEAYDKTWPSTRSVKDAVTVQYIAGWQNAINIPGTIKSAMLLLIGHLYENREQSIIGVQVNEIPFGIEALLHPHRVIKF